VLGWAAHAGTRVHFLLQTINSLRVTDNTSDNKVLSPATTPGLRLDQSPVSDQASARAFSGAGLRASALPNIFAVIVRFTEAGSNAFMIRFSRPGMILERFTTPFWAALYQVIPIIFQQLNFAEWPQFCDHSVTSADVRLSVGPNLSRAACQRPVDLRQSQAWTGGPSERKSALTSGLLVTLPQPTNMSMGSTNDLGYFSPSMS
jgi:hypothetical protein